STVVVLDGGQVLEAPHAVHDLDDRAYVLGRQALRAQGELLDALVRERRPQPRVRRLVRVDEAPGAHAEERRDALDDAQARRRAVPAAQRAEVRLVDGVALLGHPLGGLAVGHGAAAAPAREELVEPSAEDPRGPLA